MPQQEVEVILLRQLASQLALPVIIVDPRGDLLYFNEPAEAILGRRFDETGEIRRGEWSSHFHPSDREGNPIKPEDQFLAIATDRAQAAHQRFWIRGLDGVRREIEGTAFPLLGQNGRQLGSFAIFWEQHES